MNRKAKWLWRALGIWIAAITVAWFYSYEANNNRITDIQNSRLQSCERTYEGIREVFKPFLQPSKTQTAKQKHDIKLFNDTIDKLKHRCTVQVNPK